MTTSAYTFEVTMIVQVLGESLEAAQNQLDQQGGYATSRETKLLATTPLVTPIKKLKAVPIKEDEAKD